MNARGAVASPPGRTDRRLITAELLSIGSELTAGETRDTNAGDLARSLGEHGVAVVRIEAVPDQLDAVADAISTALRRADLVVSTGGLGPTPDDLTREAIAAICGEEPAVDADIERWLRALWARRGLPFPELNLKQAWLIPSAVPIPNENGTAPGWWVDRPDGRVIVALPGPPREMHPMWEGWALPRLRERGLGREMEVRTLRLFGIGESQVADLIGAALLTAANPIVATYARADAVDVRIAAVHDGGAPAGEVAAAAEAEIVRRVGDHVWARGATTWAEAIDRELEARDWTLATTEASTGGTLAALLAPAARLRRAEILSEPGSRDAEADAAAVRAAASADVGLAVRMRPRGRDTAVSVALATGQEVRRERRVVFLGGVQGRHRAALTAADILLRYLRTSTGDHPRKTTRRPGDGPDHAR